MGRSGKGWGGVERRGEEELALERSSKARDLVCCASSLVLWRDSSSDWSSPQRTSSSSFSSCSCFRCDSFRSRAIFRRCVLKGMGRRKIDTVSHTLLSVDACVCACVWCVVCGVHVCGVCMCVVCACVWCVVCIVRGLFIDDIQHTSFVHTDVPEDILHLITHTHTHTYTHTDVIFLHQLPNRSHM